MMRKFIKPLTAALLSLTMAAGLLPSAGAYAANVVVQPGVTIGSGTESSKIGPGGSTSTDTSSSTDLSSAIDLSTASPDAADYLETGGVAQGSMVIDTTIPAGCIDMLALETADPIVEIDEIYSYSDMVADLKELYSRYSSHMTYHSMGTTADGRYIYEAVVGNTGADTHILITGSTHAREYITSLLVMQQLEYILQYADTGAFDGRSMKDWLDSVCIHFVPMVNPDGVSISQYGINAVRSDSLKELLYEAFANDTELGRTTLEFDEYLKYWKANARGVNINDNFDALTENITYVTDKPSADVYYGTPGSEAETQALQKLADSTHFKAVLNYHSTGSVIYWNYNDNQLVEHCRDLANNVWALTGYSMLNTGVEGGSFKAYLGLGSTPSTALTIEVGVNRAPVSIDEYPDIWNKNKGVPFYTIKWAAEKGK